MRFFDRYATGLLVAALAMSACEGPARATKTPLTIPTEPPAVTPTPTIPTNLTPITVSGTPVIIPSAIEFTPTPSPVSAPTATGSLLTPSGIMDPVIFDFQVTPQDGLDFGKTVTVSWDVDAREATLSYNYVTGPDEYSFGDTLTLDTMKGSRQLTLKAVDSLPLYVDFTLHLTNEDASTPPGQPDNPRGITSHLPAPIRCPYAWFFDHPPKWCPLSEGAARAGVAQDFENATMVAIAGTGGAAHNGVYVLSTRESWWTSYPEVEPANAPLGAAGTTSPDPAFYGLWLNGLYHNAPLKDSAGDPTGAATRYETHFQCEFSPLHDMVSECFFNLPDGRIAYLYRHAAYGRNGITWSEWTGPAS